MNAIDAFAYYLCTVTICASLLFFQENPKHTEPEPEQLITYLDDAHKDKFEKLRNTTTGHFSYYKTDETCGLIYSTTVESPRNQEEVACEHLNEGIDRAYAVVIENNLAVAYDHLTPESLRLIENMREQGAEVTMRKVGADNCSLTVKSNNPRINSTLEQDCKLFDGVINDFAKTMGVEHG